MGREWKPGDVAMVSSHVGVYAERCLLGCGVAPAGHWHAGEGTMRAAQYESQTRPLVVIDPEDREQVERFSSTYLDVAARMDNSHDRSWYDDVAAADQAQAALREFANPTPPKPAEPTGLGAVVEDARGLRWLRCIAGEATHAWKSEGATCGDDWTDWRDIDAAKVLSEGVTP